MKYIITVQLKTGSIGSLQDFFLELEKFNRANKSILEAKILAVAEDWIGAGVKGSKVSWKQ